MKKLFWRDLKSTLLPWIITTAAVIAMTAATCMAERTYAKHMDDLSQAFGTVCETAVSLCNGLMIAYLFIMFFALARRFYTNLFSDNGYLTFTLPLKRCQVFFAKFLSGMIFLAAAVTVVFLCSMAIYISNEDSGVLVNFRSVEWNFNIYSHRPMNQVFVILTTACWVFTATALAACALLIIYIALSVWARKKGKAVIFGILIAAAAALVCAGVWHVIDESTFFDRIDFSYVRNECKLRFLLSLTVFLFTVLVDTVLYSVLCGKNAKKLNLQ